jgi:hypothetical protein
MHRHLACVASCVAAYLLAFPALAESDLARLLPADTFLYIESRDLPGTMDRYAASPFGDRLAELDWNQILLFLNSLVPDRPADPPSPETKAEETADVLADAREIRGYLSGDVVLAMGGLESVIEVFAANQEVRAEFFLDEIVGEELDAADPELQAQLEREKALDAAEFAAMLSTLTVLAEVENPDSLKRLLISLVQQALPALQTPDGRLRYTEEDRQGITQYSLQVSVSDQAPAVGLFWFIQEDIWALAFTEARLQQLADALVVPPDPSFASSSRVQQAAGSYPESDSFTFFDLSFLDLVLRKGAAQAENLPAGSPMSPERLLDWLALDALLPITQGTTLEEDAFRTTGQFGFQRETALSRLFFDEQAGPVDLPPFLHRDVPQFNLADWHIGRFWTRLETELMQFTPQAAAGLGMVRMLATGQLGFDIKLQFFDHLDNGLLLVQAMDPEVMQDLQQAMNDGDAARILEINSSHPTGGQNYLIGFEMKNREVIQQSLDRLMTRFHPQGLPEPGIFLGEEILHPVPAGAAGGMLNDLVRLAMLDNWLLVSIGSPDLLQEAIIASQDPDLQLATDPEFQALRDRLPAGATALNYTSGAQQETAVRIMQSSLEMLLPEPNDGIPDLTPLGTFMDRMLQASSREGLVISTEAYLELKK